MKNQDQIRQTNPSDSNTQTLVQADDKKQKTEQLFNKLSLTQSSQAFNQYTTSQNGDNNSIKLKEDQQKITQQKDDRSKLSENDKFYSISPKEAQQIIVNIYDMKISGLVYANNELDKKISNTTDPEEQKMLKDIQDQNNLAIDKANVSKLNNELNNQLAIILRESQIMELIEESESLRKQKKAESNLAISTSNANTSSISDIFGKADISHQVISSNIPNSSESSQNPSIVIVLDQNEINQNTVKQNNVQIGNYTQSNQQQSQLPNSGNQITSTISNQANIGQSQNSSKAVIGSHTAALMAQRGGSGMVLTGPASKAR